VLSVAEKATPEFLRRCKPTALLFGLAVGAIAHEALDEVE
jgi:hypothetical protein